MLGPLLEPILVLAMTQASPATPPSQEEAVSDNREAPSREAARERLPEFVARWRDDNGVGVDPDVPVREVPIPEEVRERLVERVLDVYLGSGEIAEGDWFAYMTPEKFYRDTTFVPGPGRFDAYVLRIGSVFGWSQYAIFIHDRVLDRVSEKTAGIEGRWMQDGRATLLRQPIVAFEDLDGDGRRELVTQTREHNGTMVNRVRYDYWAIDKNGELGRILSRVTNDVIPVGREDRRIYREIVASRPKEILVEVYVTTDGVRTLELGEARLTRADDTGPFQLADKRAFVEKIDWVQAIQLIWQ